MHETQVRSLHTGLFRDASFAWLQVNAGSPDWPDGSHIADKCCMTWVSAAINTGTSSNKLPVVNAV